MTSDEMRASRNRLGLTLSQLATVLGYNGKQDNSVTLMRRYEKGERPVPFMLERLLHMFEKHGIPEEFRIRKTVMEDNS